MVDSETEVSDGLRAPPFGRTLCVIVNCSSNYTPLTSNALRALGRIRSHKLWSLHARRVIAYTLGVFGSQSSTQAMVSRPTSRSCVCGRCVSERVLCVCECVCMSC